MRAGSRAVCKPFGNILETCERARSAQSTLETSTTSLERSLVSLPDHQVDYTAVLVVSNPFINDKGDHLKITKVGGVFSRVN